MLKREKKEYQNINQREKENKLLNKYLIQLIVFEVHQQDNIINLE
jgi:hypothetical protein